MGSGNYFTYITTNNSKTTLYIGVTNDLEIRMNQHFENRGQPETFAGRYYCYNLVWYEHYNRPLLAIGREKEIKKWSRKKKVELIEKSNPNWDFLNKQIWKY
ncbi:MAG: putative endonuclease [Sphingobacteriales bacterium]|jgi:putative endonuclease